MALGVGFESFGTHELPWVVYSENRCIAIGDHDGVLIDVVIMPQYKEAFSDAPHIE